MANIKQVAKLAGVSTSTVSRTLSNKIPVGDATRERVLTAVRKLGYRPNMMAKGLKEGRSNTIALIVPDLINPFFPKLVKCMEHCALEHGYYLILCDSGGDEDLEKRYVESMHSHYVDGVLYISVVKGDERARMLKEQGVPIVVVNRKCDVGVPCVSNDNRHGAFTIIDYLVKCGHRKISCLAAPLRSPHYKQRYRGCLDAFAAHGIDDFEKYLVEDVLTAEQAYEATKTLLSRPDRPTAIFTFIDFMAIGVYSGVSECGLSVPDDVSVAGFDNISISAHMIPPLTTYEHPVEEIADRAVKELLGVINGTNREGASFHELSGSLVVRKSVKCIQEKGCMA
jgi:Transcriptional regulators